MKKKVLKIVLAVIILFAAYNIAWFAWSRTKYGRLSDGMEKADFGNLVVPRYTYTDDDRFDYMVKYPDYLRLTGNIYVGLSGTNENPFHDGLIAWPTLSGAYDLGVVLYDEDGSEHLVYIDSEGNALSQEDEEVVSRHSDNISTLLSMADEQWGILG